MKIYPKLNSNLREFSEIFASKLAILGHFFNLYSKAFARTQLSFLTPAGKKLLPPEALSQNRLSYGLIKPLAGFLIVKRISSQSCKVSLPLEIKSEKLSYYSENEVCGVLTSLTVEITNVHAWLLYVKEIGGGGGKRGLKVGCWTFSGSISIFSEGIFCVCGMIGITSSYSVRI